MPGMQQVLSKCWFDGVTTFSALVSPLQGEGLSGEAAVGPWRQVCRCGREGVKEIPDLWVLPTAPVPPPPPSRQDPLVLQGRERRERM